MSNRSYARAAHRRAVGPAAARQPVHAAANTVPAGSMPDAGTQLANAARFGHNFGAVSVTNSHPNAAIQRVLGFSKPKLSPLQQAKLQAGDAYAEGRKQRLKSLTSEQVDLLIEAGSFNQGDLEVLVKHHKITEERYLGLRDELGQGFEMLEQMLEQGSKRKAQS
jgi:hypothetical protein